MKQDLTDTQAEILDFIVKYIKREQLPPIRSEISDFMGFSSDNAAQEQLIKLEQKGWIKLLKGKARGIRVLK